MWSRGSGVGQEKVERHPPSASKDPARPSQQQLQVQVQSRSSCSYRSGAALAAERRCSCRIGELQPRAAAAAVGTRTDQTSLRFFAPFRSWLNLG